MTAPTVIVDDQAIPVFVDCFDAQDHAQTAAGLGMAISPGRESVSHLFWHRSRALDEVEAIAVYAAWEFWCDKSDPTSLCFSAGLLGFLWDVRNTDLQAAASAIFAALDDSITGDIPFFDIEDAPLSEAWAVAIINGVHPTHPNRYRADSSRLVMAVTFAMVRANMTNHQIGSILLNKDHRISDHIYRQTNPRRAVCRAIDRARNRI